MKEKQKYISIKFDIKPPQDIRHSFLNTLILLIREITDMEDYKGWDEMDTKILNKYIENAKTQLDSLKIIKFEEDKQ